VTDPVDLPRFDGQVVLVTGGCRGIGLGIAERFAQAGAQIAICCRHEPDDLPHDWLFVAADIREAEQVDAVIAATPERFGRLDVLVNNAGGSPPADTATVSPRFTAGSSPNPHRRPRVRKGERGDAGPAGRREHREHRK
jgi:NAD(P)-dependent dehydrogenase (short-subunit alcohol dehydrogenase family)